jgi:hypothetical protein
VSLSVARQYCGKTEMKYDLTFPEAVTAWIGRELGMKKRDLCARFDVDPRRLYEVWQQEEHVRSREVAIRLFRILFPYRTPTFGFEPHEPKWRWTAHNQLSLW